MTKPIEIDRRMTTILLKNQPARERRRYVRAICNKYPPTAQVIPAAGIFDTLGRILRCEELRLQLGAMKIFIGAD
jgi:hypothetical protein